MLVRIGRTFELEICRASIYLRLGRRAVFLSPGNSAVDWR